MFKLGNREASHLFSRRAVRPLTCSAWSGMEWAMIRASATVKAAAVIVGGWLLLFLLGHPLPFLDDLFFLGGAMNLAAGHGFWNPYCPAITLVDPRPEFFVYMPLHGYVMAGWIKLFGVSRMAFCVFQCLAAALSTWGLWLALRRFSDGLLLPIGLVMSVAVFLGSTGMRPETLGLLLLVWGWVLLEMRTPIALFFAGLLLGASIFTSPNVGVLAPVAAGWGIVQMFRKEPRARAMLEVLLLGAGAVAALGLFLGAIHFELGRFLEIFDQARKDAQRFLNAGLFDALSARPILWRDAARVLLQLLEPIGIMMLATALVIWRRNWFNAKFDLPALTLLWAGGVVMLVPAVSSAAGHAPLSFFAVVVCLVIASNVKPAYRIQGALVWTPVFLVLLFAIGHRTLQVLCHPHVPAGQAEAVRTAVAQASSGPVYIDEFATALIYDYRLPPNALDYHFGQANVYGSFSPEQFPKGGLLVVSKETLARVHKLAPYRLGPEPALMPMIGRFYAVKLANPGDIVVIPSGPAQ